MGGEAWTMIQEQSFDLVVLANSRRDGGLKENLQRIEMHRLPVVFFTGEKKLTQQERIFGLGVHDYLVKSVSIAEFEMRIKAILDREEDLRVEIANLR